MGIRPDQIGILSNPGATRMQGDMVAFQRTLAESHPDIRHEIISAIEEVPDVLRRFAAADIKFLMINGGDGTLQLAVTALLTDQPFHQLPFIAVLPGGQTNLAAEALNFSGDAVQHALDLVHWAGKGELERLVRPLPFLKLELMPGVPPIYGTFFGTGSVVRGLELVRRRIFPLGLPNGMAHALGAAYLVLSGLWPFKGANSPMRPENAVIDFGDRAEREREYFIILATTLDRLLLGVRAASSVGEGAVRYTSVQSGAGSILRAARTLLFGRPGTKLVKGLIRRSTQALRIKVDCPVTLDGEFLIPRPGEWITLSASDPLPFVTLPETTVQ